MRVRSSANNVSSSRCVMQYTLSKDSFVRLFRDATSSVVQVVDAFIFTTCTHMAGGAVARGSTRW